MAIMAVEVREADYTNGEQNEYTFFFETDLDDETVMTDFRASFLSDDPIYDSRGHSTQRGDIRNVIVYPVHVDTLSGVKDRIYGL